MATIKEILSMSLDDRIKTYRATDIDKVIIDGNPFTDYKAFSFVKSKSYVKEPVRSGAGVIDNLNSYATFLTPRLKINFSMLSIDSYRILMEILRSKNEFVVSCYDVVENKIVTNKMYFLPEDLPTLWTIAEAINGDENAIMLLGVQDYTIEMVGTNSDLNLLSTMYYYDTNKSSVEYGEDVYVGQEIIIGEGIDFVNNPPVGYKFSHWVTENGTKIDNGIEWRVNSNIILFAVWQPTTK